MTTSYVASKIYPLTSSQAKHTKGIGTNLGVSTSQTRTCTASASFTSGYNGIFISLAAELGVSYSESFTFSTNVGYSIPSSMDSGMYRIIIVFPALRVYRRVFDSSASGNVTIWEKTTTYAPEAGSQYHDLQRYADA